MGKSDTVAAQKAALLAAQDAAVDQVLGATWDEAALEQKASDGTLTDADLQAAVKAATDPLNAQIAVLESDKESLQAKDASDLQALADAQAKATSDLAALQKALDDMTAKEQLEEQAVADVNAKVQQVESALDATKAAFAQVQAIFAVLNPPPASSPEISH